MEDISPSQQIDTIVKMYSGWKGETLSRIRAAIKAAAPNVTEQVKWKMPSRPEGLPVWSRNGILCILETFKDNQKLVFFKGAQMKDVSHYFNARLKSTSDRAIEFREGSAVDEVMLRELVLSAVRINDSIASKKP